MRRPRHLLRWLAPVIVIPLMCGCTWVGAPWLASWVYTTGHLLAGWNEMFVSAEDGMRARIAQGYVQPDEVEIVYAGTNSFDGSDPGVWYVIACVWGGRRANGSPVGSQRHVYDQPGSFFLNTKDGWVWVPELAFPERVGFWMQVYGLAGPGSARPSHGFGDSPRARCAASSGW